MSIVPRDRWCTTPPRGTPARIATRQDELWLHHGAAGSSTLATANAYARHHIRTLGWQDVGYSWLIAAGQVLEGRGPGRQGAHTAGRNTRSYGICMVGDYTSRLPDRSDLDALVWLLRHGADKGWWDAPRLTGGHRDAPGASTTCPGTPLHRHIPTINAQAAQPDQEDDDMPSAREIVDEIERRLDAERADIDRGGHGGSWSRWARRAVWLHGIGRDGRPTMAEVMQTLARHFRDR